MCVSLKGCPLMWWRTDPAQTRSRQQVVFNFQKDRWQLLSDYRAKSV
jgi:hypothetical protein